MISGVPNWSVFQSKITTRKKVKQGAAAMFGKNKPGVCGPFKSLENKTSDHQTSDFQAIAPNAPCVPGGMVADIKAYV